MLIFIISIQLKEWYEQGFFFTNFYSNEIGVGYWSVD